MKLRLRGNSVRLRLTSSEVAAVRDQGGWQDATTFGPTGAPLLVYRVEAADVPQPSARFTTGAEATLTVVLPMDQARAWADSSSQVGLYFEESWGLKVAVEKDFRCLDPNRDEDESDNFDNPNAGNAHHSECHVDE